MTGSRDAAALSQPRSQRLWEMLRATLYLNIHRSPQQSRDHLVQEFFILGGGGVCVCGGPFPKGAT